MFVVWLRAAFMACVIVLHSAALAGHERGFERFLTADSFAGPGGFQAFCAERGEWCRQREIADRPALTPRLQDLLASVQRRVNAAIEPIVEPPGRDLWQIGPLSGDCEDYALTKFDLLMDAGVGPSAMRLAVGFTETDEYHAVLVVETDAGSIVLDNRFDEPLAIEHLTGLGYRWIAAQSLDDPMRWRLTREGQALARTLQSDDRSLPVAAY